MDEVEDAKRAAAARGTEETDEAGMGEHARAGGASFATRPAPFGAGPGSFSPADVEKQRGVRRMKTTATGLLLLVAVIYVLAKWGQNSGAGAWAGYVAAAAEAGMVGALADWFAVTALFRRPSACPSRTRRSSRPRRTSWASRSASSSGRTSSPPTSYGSGCAPSASVAGSAPGWPNRSTPTG